MLQNYLINVQYRVVKTSTKTKYVVKAGSFGTKLTDVVAKLKEIQRYMTELEFVVVPVAQSGEYVVEVVADRQRIWFRLSRGVDTIDVMTQADVNDVKKALELIERGLSVVR